METSKAVTNQSAWMWVGVVALGAAARLLPHPWNFTPLVAIGLFAGAHARKAGIAVLATLLSLALSDGVLGFYRGFWWVYAAALISVLLGRAIRERHEFCCMGGRPALSAQLGGSSGVLRRGSSFLCEPACRRRALHGVAFRRLYRVGPVPRPAARDGIVRIAIK